MLDEQLPGDVREFAGYLRQLLDALDPEAGWYGVFAQRDPDGVRACLEGREVLPWDVVDSLLQDLAVRHGARFAESRRPRTRELHRAAIAAYDRWVGGHDALLDRLDVMLREKAHAGTRERELGTALGSVEDRAEAGRLEAELAWARDDRERAAARCAELRARLDALEHGVPERDTRPHAQFPHAQPPYGAPPHAQSPYGTPPHTQPPYARFPHAPSPHAQFPHGAPAYAESGHADPANAANPGAAHDHFAHTDPVRGTSPPADPPPADPAPADSARRRTDGRDVPLRGARFAGIESASGTEAPAVPDTAEPPADAPGTPRGARFAGAYAAAKQPRAPKQPRAGRRGNRDRDRDRDRDRERRRDRDEAAASDPQPSPELAAAGRATDEAVARLAALRADGSGGEAYVLLCEAVAWPADRLPLLVAALERSGLAADVATLLWEASCLPPPALAAAAAALADAGRGDDCRTLLRQAVARPAPELAATVFVLRAEDRTGETRALLDALLRSRTPEEAARVAEADPETLVPLLLDAAAGVSTHRLRDLAHVLRLAGLQGVPDTV
ncbi:hypothetical protein [Streptomyces sp. NPDC048639]|uniref:hypothetical protein n=1 Tax=Streptomyces sp. NPDC048639 TaxID=3365581 RepID=UPI00371FFA01